MMTVGGLLPKTNAPQISFVGSSGPSSFDGGGGKSSGVSGNLLFVGCDSRVSVFFWVICGFWAVFCTWH